MMAFINFFCWCVTAVVALAMVRSTITTFFSRDFVDSYDDRLSHLWYRSLMINDERMVIFEEACEILDVDSEVDTPERCAIEDCFFDINSGVSVAELRKILGQYNGEFI